MEIRRSYGRLIHPLWYFPHRQVDMFTLDWVHDLVFRPMYFNQHTSDSLHIQSGCGFIKVSRAIENNLAKIYNSRNHMYGENLKLKLCTCGQSMALGTRRTVSLEFSCEVRNLQYTNLERIFGRAGEALVKHPLTPASSRPDQGSISVALWI